MTETLAYEYSSESIQWEVSDEYQHDRVKKGFQKFLRFCAFEESSLSIERAKRWMLLPLCCGGKFGQYKMMQKNLRNDGNPGIWVLI